MFASLLADRQIKDIERISKQVGTELRDLKEFIAFYQRKLKFLRDFVGRIGSRRNLSKAEAIFERMKGIFTSVDKFEFLVDERDSRKDREMIAELSDIERKDVGERALAESIKGHINELFSVRRALAAVVAKEIVWFKEHKSFESAFKREEVQPLLGLVRQEGELLFDNGLSGFKGERELIVEIYNQVMPLKERVKIEKVGKGRASTVFSWTWIDGRIRVVKKYGMLTMGRKWSYEQAKKRLENNKRFYAFLKEAGVSVPDHNDLYVIEQWEKTPSGARPTGYYQAVLNQEHIGKNAALLIRESSNRRFIRALYRQMLHNAYRAIIHNTHWMLDFKPANFCWNGKRLVFVDTETIHMYPMDDPAGRDFIVRTDIPVKEQIRGMMHDIRTVNRGWTEKDWTWSRFKRADRRGQFIELLEQTVAMKIALKQMFEQETLNFLKRRRMMREFKFMSRYIRKPMYEFNVFRLVRYDAPEDLPLAAEMLKRRKEAKGFAEKL
ncbi:hypothetical protein KY361_01475 [Candidatus Woesearchaeota archaeon]|nr:hypothetical protein [Candidatus Woesearchaeota archaeon]